MKSATIFDRGWWAGSAALWGISTLASAAVIKQMGLREDAKPVREMKGWEKPKKIVVVSSCPQIRYPDCYGIDMSKMGDFIAFRRRKPRLDAPFEAAGGADLRYLLMRPQQRHAAGFRRRIALIDVRRDARDDLAEVFDREDFPGRIFMDRGREFEMTGADVDLHVGLGRGSDDEIGRAHV